MKILALTTAGFALASAVAFAAWRQYPPSASTNEPEFEDLDGVAREPLVSEPIAVPWKRPEGPLRVGLQVGHWKNRDLPDELGRLRERGGGSRGGGKAEWEVNLAIAEAVSPLLEADGVVVDILPATVPPGYWADAFIAIHADGNSNPDVSGFKAASPRRDRTGQAARLANMLEAEYGAATGFRLDPNVTRNMRGYYAFNWRRYGHAIHPMTPGAIIETGFLTSPSDRRLLIGNPQLPARAIANGIIRFLEQS